MQPRDLEHFLDDVKRYEAQKKEKLTKRIEDKQAKTHEEETFKPAVDELSSQIVDMMEDRKGILTQDRLYNKGQEKLRQIAAKEA